tara:strand:+ start:34 stop:489 length:456 start_codon:yes stop_codon:yes gene_type:complete
MREYIFFTRKDKIMNEIEIYNQLSLSLNTTALFGLVWAFLLWVAGRSASVALENNAGVLMKIAVTVFGLVSLYQFNIALSWVRFNFESAAHSLAVLKESGVDISARAESFINNANGSTDVPVFNITPDLIGILFLLSVGYLIVGRLWLGHK